MADIKVVGHELANILKKYRADYIEARLEESQTTQIAYRGKELESVAPSASTTDAIEPRRLALCNG